MRILTLALVFSVGCGEKDPEDSDPAPPVQPVVEIPELGPAVVHSYLYGSFEVLPDFVGPIQQVTGKAMLTRMIDGTSTVSLQISELSPSTAYSAHVHTRPCEYNAGPHYKYDPSVEETVDTNEVWPDFTTDAMGDGWTALSVPSTLRGDAMSVIVHDPETNDKLACADLLPETNVPETASGTFASFALADPVIDVAIGGSVQATITQASTELDISWTGLDDTYLYSAHVHALPCDTTFAGGHYKYDPNVEETLPENEIWPEVTVSGAGASTTLTLPRALRADGQAVVLHREGDKVACADITRGSYSPQRSFGTIQLFQGAIAAGLDGLRGSGTIERRLDGYTVIDIELEGLLPQTAYPVHLHNRDCGTADGGTHYAIDPAIMEVDEANEIWAPMVTDETGAASQVGYAAVIARADAQSLVVHGDEGVRLGCIDLY